MDLNRFEEQIEKCEQISAKQGDIMLYGSSFFKNWGYERARQQLLEASNGKFSVLNHGFGGAMMDELLYYYHRMVRPYKMKIILLRCGINDIYHGMTADETWFLTERLLEWIRTDYPEVKIGLLGIFDVIRGTEGEYREFVKYNEFLKKYAKTAENVWYIDLNGFFYENPKDIGTRQNFRDVFIEDGLHLTDEAYAEMAEYLTAKLLEKAKILIFDMDGVILDSEPLHEEARQIMFQEMKIVLDDSYPDPVGKAMDEFWDLIFKKLGVQGDGIEKEKQHYQVVAKMIEEKHVGPNEGLLETIQWAKEKGMKVAIASSSPRFLVDEVLRLLNLGQYFDCTVSGDEVLNRKPEPDVYQKVLELMGMKPEEAIAVEDSSTGVAAAKAAGCYCFGYVNPGSGEQNLQKTDCLISHLADIKQLYKEGIAVK